MRAFQTVRLLSDALKTAPRAWVKVAYPGRFLGHAAGPFEMTTRTFDEIVTNFKARGTPVVVDVNHSSENPATNCSVEGASAKGWFRDLERRGTDLWGEIEVKPSALSAIREGGLPFLSPAIKFGCKDPETGKPIGARLSSVALCTNPFLHRQAPLQLSEGAGEGEEALVDYASALRDALDLGGDAPPALLRQALDRVDLLLTDAVAAEQARALGVDPCALEARVRAASGVGADTSWAELVDMLRAMTDETAAPAGTPALEALPPVAASPAPPANNVQSATPAAENELQRALTDALAANTELTTKLAGVEQRAASAEARAAIAETTAREMTERLATEAKTVVMRDLERGVIGFTKADAPRLVKMWTEEPDVYAKTTSRRPLPAYMTQSIAGSGRPAAGDAARVNAPPPPPAPKPSVRQMTDAFMGEGLSYDKAFTAATNVALGLAPPPKGK
jgi:Mu-like prophage I protein